MFAIRDIARVERSRKRFIKYGPAQLSNTELLAIILRSGLKGENVLVLSNKILKKFGSENLPVVSCEELRR